MYLSHIDGFSDVYLQVAQLSWGISSVSSHQLNSTWSTIVCTSFITVVVKHIGHGLEFCIGCQVWQTPKEGWNTFRRNIENITIKMKIIVWKPWIIKIIKFFLKYLDMYLPHRLKKKLWLKFIFLFFLFLIKIEWICFFNSIACK